MPIEADLERIEAFSPGREAAVGVRSRLAEGERAVSTFMSNANDSCNTPPAFSTSMRAPHLSHTGPPPALCARGTTRRKVMVLSSSVAKAYLAFYPPLHASVHAPSPPGQYLVGAAPAVGARTPSALRRKGAVCTGSGAAGASSTETPWGHSGGQRAMRRQ